MSVDSFTGGRQQYINGSDHGLMSIDDPLYNPDYDRLINSQAVNGSAAQARAVSSKYVYVLPGTYSILDADDFDYDIDGITFIGEGVFQPSGIITVIDVYQELASVGTDVSAILAIVQAIKPNTDLIPGIKSSTDLIAFIKENTDKIPGMETLLNTINATVTNINNSTGGINTEIEQLTQLIENLTDLVNQLSLDVAAAGIPPLVFPSDNVYFTDTRPLNSGDSAVAIRTVTVPAAGTIRLKYSVTVYRSTPTSQVLGDLRLVNGTNLFDGTPGAIINRQEINSNDWGTALSHTYGGSYDVPSTAGALFTLGGYRSGGLESSSATLEVCYTATNRPF